MNKTNKIYNFYGVTALRNAEKFVVFCTDELEIPANCIDMMQDSDGTDESIAITIAVYTMPVNHLCLSALEDAGYEK